MKYFCITSHGWSASNWVAYSYNLHDDIICTHSALNDVPNEKEMHQEDKLKNNILRFHKGYSSRTEIPLNDSYRHIRSFGEAKVYGSVHLFRLRDLKHQTEISAPFDNKISIINLVRNPISLVWSGYGQFKQLFKFDLNELHWTLGKLLNTDKDFVYEIGFKYQIEIGNYDVLAFLCACRVLESLRIDLDAEQWIIEYGTGFNLFYGGTVMMEEMTSNRDYFKSSFRKLNLDDLVVSDEYLDTVFSTGKVNKHKVDSIDKSPNHIFNSFSDWQKEVFLHFFNKYELRAAYEKMGYDFSYIK